MRSRTFKITLLLCLVIAGLAVAAWAIGMIGYDRSGTAQSAAELPVAGAELANLQPTGVVYYKLYKAPRGPHLVASGTTTLQDMKRFCELFNLEFNETDPSAGAELRTKLESYRGDQARITVDFGNVDAFAFGRHPKVGRIELHYRYRDGAWTASVSQSTDEARPGGAGG